MRVPLPVLISEPPPLSTPLYVVLLLLPPTVKAMGVLASFRRARLEPVPALLAARPPKVKAFAETLLSKIRLASELRVTVLFCNASRFSRTSVAPPVAPG